jgi:formiminoglutamate deiminase
VLITYWAEYAWRGGGRRGTSRGVVIDVDGPQIMTVTEGVLRPPDGAIALPGLTLPGLANAHSHAFHRALRGRTHTGKGTFWTWRERMYAIAARLDPDAYQALARATFAEMALAGVTCVGEFHYLHHAPDGVRYTDPNEMGHRLIEAAAQAGIRITLLDTLYLSSTVDGDALAGPQLRFGDGSVDAWATRVADLKAPAHARLGAAAHSVRAVPARDLAAFAQHTVDVPAHIHLSEQRAENEACLAVHGMTPTALLESCGLVGPAVTAVHATHLSEVDRTILGDSATRVCLCPTTERDLADGIALARAQADAGSPLCLGSDSHASIDLLDEARALELDERLRDEHRGHFDTDELLTAATSAGHAALGWPEAGRIEAGAVADLVTVRLDTVRTAGFDPVEPAASVLFGACAADIQQVIVGGRPVVQNGRHLLIDDVPAALSSAVEKAWS